MSNWSSGDVTANGINIHYHRTGGAKPPLVVSHGFSDNGLCWTRLAKVLEKDYDVIMPDARGHGMSDASEKGYTSADHAADLAGLIQALGLGKPAAMGHSMGAATVATLAALYPDLVTCAILEDPPWFAPGQRRARGQDRHARVRRFKQMTHQEIVQAGHGEQEHPTWDEIEFDPWADAKLQMSLNVVRASEGRTTEEPRGHWQDIAPQIQCPSLLVTADPDLDAIITPEVAQQIAQMNGAIQVIRLDGAGHNIRREQFDPFVQAVTEFLSRVYA